jgi:hypothetical protein
MLYQSIVMITTQLIILETCIKYSTSLKGNNIFEIENFWNYKNYISYCNYNKLKKVQIILIYTMILLFLFIFFRKKKYFIEFLGVLALSIEAVLCLPQFLTNLERKNVDGLR